MCIKRLAEQEIPKSVYSLFSIPQRYTTTVSFDATLSSNLMISFPLVASTPPNHTSACTHVSLHKKHTHKKNDTSLHDYHGLFFDLLPLPSGEDLHRSTDHWCWRCTALINESEAATSKTHTRCDENKPCMYDNHECVENGDKSKSSAAGVFA